MTKIFHIKLFIAGILLLGITGCGSLETQKQQYVEVDKSLENGQYKEAVLELISNKAKYFDEKDKVLYYLNLGMLQHYAKQYNESNQNLTEAENGIDELYTKSISKGAASLFVNDNVLDYSGEDYENIYVNVFKALNYLELNKFDDAFVEIRRIDDKLSLFKDKYQKLADEYNNSDSSKKQIEIADVKFNNSALGRLLSLLIYRTENKYDDARIDLEKIKEAWQLEGNLYDFKMPSLDNLLSEKNGDNTSTEKSKTDNSSNSPFSNEIVGPYQKAKVDILSFVGRSPEKFANTFIIHTLNNLAIIYRSNGKSEQRIDAIPWPGLKANLHFKFSLPYMEKLGSRVSRIEVKVDSQVVKRLEKMEDIENIAKSTFEIKKPFTYVKTIIRTISKGLITETANKELDKQTGGGIFGSLTRAITSKLVDMTENADLRISRYFPAFAFIGEVELTPGSHTIQINYYDKYDRLIYYDTIDKNVRLNKLNLIESFYVNENNNYRMAQSD